MSSLQTPNKSWLKNHVKWQYVLTYNAKSLHICLHAAFPTTRRKMLLIMWEICVSQTAICPPSARTCNGLTAVANMQGRKIVRLLNVAIRSHLQVACKAKDSTLWTLNNQKPAYRTQDVADTCKTTIQTRCSEQRCPFGDRPHNSQL
jgi:hypothetical protein